jgi:hypothetical protein
MNLGLSSYVFLNWMHIPQYKVSRCSFRKFLEVKVGKSFTNLSTHAKTLIFIIEQQINEEISV